ncbi:hypothetical protein [Arcanobacterium hippocoleae]|uniref:LPXTG cell wall anchor domain-containing protein n=1 Tax=Arcanobacterium hippocoleae TaxID=149017 RepID=A0ABU1T0Z6_9ACTO|nr:hypothetical protein [Arcanobacterium hippocoleae]MDR6939044.1 hypothetical protein [Arcanobacterium hippocoleae]
MNTRRSRKNSTFIAAGIISVGLLNPLQLPQAAAETPLQNTAIQAIQTATATGDARRPNFEIPCTDSSLRLRLPQPNPFDRLPDSALKEPTGAGFEITLRQVAGINLNDHTQWEKIRELTIAQANTLGFIGEPHTGITNAQAQVEFKHLPIGVYLVTAKAPIVPGYKISQLDPFLITLPLAVNNTWQCAADLTAKTHYSIQPEPIAPPPTPPTPPAPPKPPGNLSKTGAAVMGLSGISVMLFGIGAMLLKRRKTNTDQHTTRQALR